MKYSGRNKVLFYEPQLDSKEENKEVSKQETNLELIIKQKNFRQEKYLELVKRFIDENCDYEFMKITSHDEIKKAYNHFLRNIEDSSKNLNISLAISVRDIASLDNRYTYKRVHLCKSCNRRQFSKCCDDYNIKNRKSVYYMVNLKLKDSII